jgi:hypothetical protein
MAHAQLCMGFISEKMRFSHNHTPALPHLNMLKELLMVGQPKYYVYLTETPTLTETRVTTYSLFDDWVGQKNRIGNLRLPRQTMDNFGWLYFDCCRTADLSRPTPCIETDAGTVPPSQFTFWINN